MTEYKYAPIGAHYCDSSQVPRDDDIFYKCADCGTMICSVPTDNTGCRCGNVFIDKDYWRLVVSDFTRFEVLRRTNKV